MAEIINAEINLTKLGQEPVAFTGKNGDKYVKVSIMVNDNLNTFNKNVAIIRPQSKEERQAKQNPTFLGNGLSIWKDGSVTAFLNEIKNKSQNQSNNASQADDDLPW